VLLARYRAQPRFLTATMAGTPARTSGSPHHGGVPDDGS
jgi:hypothetical protein